MSVRPLITEQAAVLGQLARPSRAASTRTTITSTISLSTRAKSAMLSRLPKPTSSPSIRLLPPRWVMPASKLTRVRSDGFSNNSASTRPGSSGSRSPCANLVLRSSVIEKIRWISAAETSARVIRCRMVVADESVSTEQELVSEPTDTPSTDSLLLRRVIPQHVGQDVAAFVDLLVGEGHRRQQPDHGLLRAVDQAGRDPGIARTIGAPSIASSRPIISPHTRSSSTIAQLVDQRAEPLAEQLAELRRPAPAGLLPRSFRSWRCRPGRRSDCRRTWPRACRAAGWGRSRPWSACAAPAMPPHRLLASVMTSGVTPKCW